MKLLLDILRGCAIGIANIIPGVSGGTMAVTMGVYDKILFSVNNLFRQFKKSVLTLLPLGIGVVIGLIGLSFGIEYLFEYFPLPTALCFIGLILGGVPMLYKRIKGKQIGVIGILLFVAFFALLLLLPVIAGGERTTELVPGVFTAVKLFFVGILASATMVIPGVSGSMILMSIGYYSPIISAINDFIRALASFDVQAMLTPAALLIPFGIGVLLGIFLIAKLISYLLQRFEVYTYCAVLGLVLSSPVSILTSIDIPSPSIPTILAGIVALLVGGAAAFFLGREKEGSDA